MLVVSGWSGLAATPEASFPAAEGLAWDIQLAEFEPEALGEVTVVEIDGAEATAADVDRLHRERVTAICYINAGAWEEWRTDAGAYPAELLGHAYPGWAGGRPGCGRGNRQETASRLYQARIRVGSIPPAHAAGRGY